MCEWNSYVRDHKSIGFSAASYGFSLTPHQARETDAGLVYGDVRTPDGMPVRSSPLLADADARDAAR